ncbi:DEAD/DEAH box helicase [Vallitalea pronyensis]|uniref:ATP-dependent RNA helicase CshA n=1 Tax=Vallitalea pronyensis TaxID=1348613 RepID=A0A8J8SGE1_9FIRM|nr:DEAD/DEAH box helicase [Vallitalea pronyensis]QUI22675.1 DEAD/DEAH box helicase [Vallitalea pronyensis]
MKFTELDISENLLKAVTDMGFEEATEIQEKSIPLILSGEDMIGQSQTGTGKTAAFALPILEKVDPKIHKPQVIVLCPTRELAVQVCGEFNKLSKYTGIKSFPVYGGEPIYRQISALKRGVQIVIGTPGRLMDHMNRKTLKLDHIKSIILDEADEMLNMGFREDIETILKNIPTDDIQTILFSATMPKSIMDITHLYQNNPKLVKITRKELTTDTIDQRYYHVLEHHKLEVLRRLLDVYNPKLSLIFCNTKRKVDEVTELLQDSGYACDKIHGDMNQVVRLSVLGKFNKGVINILVATDVAARGLDIQNVEAVFNYDVPENEEYYVHRIGRTGRAGKKGMSFTLVSRSETRRISNIIYYIKKKIPRKKIPSIDKVNAVKINTYIDNLASTIDTSLDLGRYEHIIDKLNEKGYDASKIAAALLMSNLELKEENNKNLSYEISRKQFTTNRPHQSNRRPQGREKGMARLYLNIGKNHKVAIRDIVGAVAGESKIKGSVIGSIDMYDKYTFVEVPEKLANQVITAMNRSRIKGKNVTMELANTKRTRR